MRIAHALLLRADAIDTARDRGSVHEALFAVEAALAPAAGGSIERAREHFRKARELSGGRLIGPLVTLAEAVCVKADLFVEVTP